MGEASAHAILSPSSAKRWMACTPSARFEQQFPNVETVFAAEGTLAHSLGEAVLQKRLGLLHPHEYDLAVSSIQKNELYTPEMLTHAEQYADFCLAGSEPNSPHAIETRLDITEFIPEGFGTGDYMRVDPSKNLLIFRDLKYGKGVAVSSEDNTQLKIYAIGALAWWGWVYDIETISVGIYQPRIDNNSTWEISVKDLMHWAETELSPKAKLAFAGEGDYVVGDHCKFCRARVRCQALADHNLDLFKHELKSHEQLSDAALLEILKKAPLLTSWAKDIESYVLSEAVKGKKWDGLKLVQGKSDRVFVSKAATEEKLINAGYVDIYTSKELLGVTKLKETLGTKVFKELVEPDLRKPPGKPTLASIDDSRAEYDNAVAIFKDVEIKEEIE